MNGEGIIGDIVVSMAIALFTTVLLGLTGLVMTAFAGRMDVRLHISVGIYSTLVVLLAHSMMMFYLIGKGRAVKDAMAAHNLTGDYAQRIAAARKPVFSIGTLALSATILTAILGASVDTGVLPPAVHVAAGIAAIGFNVVALKAENAALSTSYRVVEEVNRLIGA